MLAVCDANRASGKLPPPYTGERAIDFGFGFLTTFAIFAYLAWQFSDVLVKAPRPLQPVIVALAYGGLYLLYWLIRGERPI
jgi:hypothetical protein